MSAIVDNFSGADGAAWSATIWQANSGAGTRSLQSNSGQIVTPASAFNPGNGWTVNTHPADFDATFTVTTVTTDTTTWLWFRASGPEAYAAYATAGYGLLLFSDSYSWLVSRVAGTNNLLAQGSPLGTPSANDVYHFRVRMIGTSLWVRVWKNATTEPSTWLMTVTDATYATGRFGFAVENNSGAQTLQIASLAIGQATNTSSIGGAVAPTSAAGMSSPAAAEGIG